MKKYKDRNTLHQSKKWEQYQNTEDTFWNWDSRKADRKLKRSLSDFSIRISDKIWWRSLSQHEQSKCMYSYLSDGIKDEDVLKEMYKGDVSKLREEKIKLLLKD